MPFKLAQHLLGDRPRGFGPDLTTAARAEGARHSRQEQLQVIVDLRHRADGRARAFHRVRLLDRDRRRNAAYFVDPRLVHALKELPRVRAEGLDVTALAFGVDRVESQARFAAPARARDDGQLAERQVEIEALEIVLAGSTNFNAAPLHGRDDAGFLPLLEATDDNRFGGLKAQTSEAEFA